MSGLNLSTSISKKLLVGVVLSSALVTIFVTLFQLSQDYKQRIEVTEGHFDTLMHINRRALETSLWDLNIYQTKSIMEGYLGHQSVDYMKLSFDSVEGKQILEFGKTPEDFLSKNFILKFEGEKIGEVLFISDKNHVYNYLVKNLSRIIIINTIKTFLASFLILFVINKLLTIHLLKIVNFFKNRSLEDNLELQRIGPDKYNNDELTELVSEINSMLKDDREIKNNLELKIRERTEEYVKAQIAAEKATIAKSRFLANMSHEIRTPMNGIVGCANLLKDKVKDAEGRDLLNTLLKSNEILMTLINDILDVSKLESGNLELEKRSFSLRKCVNDVITLMQIAASQKDVELKANIDRHIPEYIEGDSTRLQQILMNLVNNGIKFTQNGSVQINVKQDAITDTHSNLVFEVVDTGIGIAPAAMTKLFKRFSQVDPSTTRKYGGTGLGLAICKGFVELMGGKIWAESELKKGTSFFFSLRFKIGEEIEETYEVNNSSLTEYSDIKILLAEDNMINRKVVLKHLEKLGVKANVAVDGVEAVNKAKNSDYDLILMDLHMPNLDGVGATKKIKSLNLINSPVIIALTASVMEEDRVRCLQAGMQDFLTKPIKSEDLQRILVKYFNKESQKAS